MSSWRAAPVPASGLRLAWTRWHATALGEAASVAPREPESVAVVRWDNEAWTVEGTLGADDAQYVLRLGADWRVQQCLLFRDLPTPDLWLGTDGRGRWGEVNGAHRPELAGCELVEFAASPFHHGVAVRAGAAGALEVGGAATVRTARIDVETLGVLVVERTYVRTGATTWRWTSATTGDEVDATVDAHGFVRDEPGAWRRVGD